MRANLIMTLNDFKTFYCVAIRKFCELTMPLDINKYRKYVDDFDLTEEQKKDLLKTVWAIMESFVDKAFGKHPVQQCRKLSSERDLQSPKHGVESAQLSHHFRKFSAPKSGCKTDWAKVRKETRHYDGPQ